MSMMMMFYLGRTRHILINGNIDVKHFFIRKTNRSLTPLGAPPTNELYTHTADTDCRQPHNKTITDMQGLSQT